MTLKYVLDSDILIHMQRGDAKIRQKFSELASSCFCTTAINKAEVYVGVYRLSENTRVRGFFETLFARLPVLNFDAEAADVFAKLKSKMLKQGNGIADLDVMIASIAMCQQLTLVTNNVRDFHRIHGLKHLAWND